MVYSKHMTPTGITVKPLTAQDDLPRFVSLMNEASWGADNEMEPYDAEALRSFVEDPATLLLAAYAGERLAGVLIATIIRKPYAKSDWLYVDEVDVSLDFRRQGVGKQLMNEALAFAGRRQLSEVWLGTEPDNASANALYSSLGPEETESFIGYTFKKS
jgi:ribosomal protein S18 acetylase RimI-like enzyme